MTKAKRLGIAIPAIIIVALIICFMLPMIVSTASPESVNTFTFTDTGITATDETGSGYKISGTSLTINEGGTYTVTGSCGDGSVTVKKGTTGVTLVLDDLSLSSSTSAPLSINKTSEATVYISGKVTLTDSENPEDENSDDEEVADAFDGAAIKVKSGASLAIKGDGTLIADGQSCKNGIKGAATSKIEIEDGVTIIVKAANNGIASDGEVIISGGNIDVTAENDGIKSEPDEDDAESKGEISISGGKIKITSGGDAVQASGALNISGGAFDIITFGGYNNNKALGDDSAKGLKSDTAVNISGGTFEINSADDAVHSDGSVTITGGKLNIKSGDDGLHADYDLIIGTKGSESGPEINIETSCEGFEGAKVVLYSGSGSITASDDGINAANSDLADYEIAIYFYGGDWYVNAAGDGLDAGGNGGNRTTNDIYLYGGKVEVYGSTNGGNSALDFDGTCTYEGGTLLAVGVGEMAQQPTSGVYVSFGAQGGFGSRGGFGGNQTSSQSGSFTINNGSKIEIKNASGKTLYTATGIKYANNVVFASEDIAQGESYSLYIDGSLAATAEAVTGSGQGSFGGFGGNGQGGFPGGNGRNGGFPGESGDENFGGMPGDRQNGEFRDGRQNGGFSGGKKLPFDDVKDGEWYEDYVRFSYERGIMNGVSDSLFDPDGGLTRAMLVQILYNLEGKPSIGNKVSFPDVKNGEWYEDAAAWAKENGITRGYEDGTFGADDMVTRAQAVTMLMNYAKIKGYDTEGAAELDYGDADKVPSWAAEPMRWAVGSGVINGDGGLLRPSDGASRAETAAIMTRFLGNVR